MSSWSDQTTLTESAGPIVEAWVNSSCLNNGNHDAVGGVGCVIESDKDTTEIHGPVPSNIRATSNRVEYFAVLSALDRIDEQLSTDVGVRVHSNSKLVVKQIRGHHRVGQSLEDVHQETRSLLDEFQYWEIKQRSESDAYEIKRADELAAQAAQKAAGRDLQ